MQITHPVKHLIIRKKHAHFDIFTSTISHRNIKKGKPDIVHPLRNSLDHFLTFYHITTRVLFMSFATLNPRKLFMFGCVINSEAREGEI